VTFLRKVLRHSLSLVGRAISTILFHIVNAPILGKFKSGSIVESVAIDWRGQIRKKYLPFFRALSELLEGNIVVLDVGARGRSLAKEWRGLANKVEFFGFDLSKDDCQKMQEEDKAIGLKSTYLPFALSDKMETRAFYVKKVPTGSSFYNNDLASHIFSHWRTLRGGEIADPADRNAIVDTIAVDTIPLDELQRRECFHTIDFVKIDAEGAELEIVRGALNVLKDALAVQLEVDFIERYNPDNLFLHIDAILNELNFSFFDLPRFLKTGRRESPVIFKEYHNFAGRMAGQVLGGDVVYLRDPFGPKPIDVDSFSREQLIKLSVIAFILGQFEYAFSIAEHLGKTDARVGGLLKRHFG
jgi:FkbM family methyltransferase